MSLRQTTRSVIEQVERVTEFPVIVNDDSSLPVMASVRVARGSARFHTINYNPTIGKDFDYVIAYQCGFILRLYAIPSEGRFDLTSKDEGRTEVDKLVRNTLPQQMRLKLGEGTLSGFRDQLYDGLMLQLRSVPVGLRVDSWILTNYPELSDQQRSATTKQLNENNAAFKAEIRQMVPPKVYRANQSMNAAFAEFWAGKWNEPTLTLVYKSTGFQKSGQSLLNWLERIPDEPVKDQQLVDAWAGDLNLSGWYSWTPYRVDS